MGDYVIKYKSIIEKLGIAKSILCIVILIILLPFFVSLYLKAFELALYYLFFAGFILFANIFILLPSFSAINYKLKITNNEISFFVYSPVGRFSKFEERHVQFPDIQNYIIKKNSLIIYFLKNNKLFKVYEKRRIESLSSEECSEINNILSQKIGDKYNSGFEPLFAWFWQDPTLNIILLLVIATVCFAFLSNYI
jgi:hypothetical protein